MVLVGAVYVFTKKYRTLTASAGLTAMNSYLCVRLNAYSFVLLNHGC